jgi:hypothetical protein
VVTDALPSLLAEIMAPAHLDREQTWQNVLRLVLPRVLPVKLHRQQAGKHKVERGGVVQGAPVGAADLSGWVVGAGLRVEVEAKYGDGKLRPAQRQWLAVCAADGVVALVLTYDERASTLLNTQAAVDALRAALLARGVGA